MHENVRYRMGVNAFAIPRMPEAERRPVISKQEAQKVWEPLFLAEVIAGRDPRRSRQETAVVTVSDFIDIYTKRHCEAERLNMDSHKQRIGRVRRQFGTLPLAALERPNAIELFKAELIENELENSTINRYLATLRHMINWAIGREYLTRSPFYHKLRNPTGIRLLRGENQRSRRLQEGEEEKLLDAADQLFRRNRVDHQYVARVMRARLEMALDFGLRRGEMLKIKNRDVDWRATPDPVLTIQWGNAKSRRQRRIALVSPRVVTWLASRRAVGGVDGHPYGDEFGGYAKDLRDAWLSLLEIAGVTDVKAGIDGDLHWHDLRHECGSRLAERGMDVRKVQELLGHASLATTQRYFNTSVQAVGAAMKKAMGW
jgi:integrase